MEKNSKGGSSSSNSSAILFVWLLVIGVVITVVQWILEAIGKFFAWVGEILTNIWNFTTFPFRYTYNFFITEWSWWKIGLAIGIFWLLLSLFGNINANRKNNKSRK